jgi:hypothetical protein
MDMFLEILKYILPSLVVMVTAFIVMRMFLESEQKRMGSKEKSEMDKVIIPLRVQAYERMILFLERISPANLILRVAKPEMDAAQLQTALVRAIREEFDHNLSQQLYLSGEAWAQVKNAKEDMIRIINTASAQVDLQAPSHLLASAVFDNVAKAKINSLGKAINFLKSEFGQLS